jgi:hypothetical protein
MIEHSAVCSSDADLLRCELCETVFEPGIADDGPQGQPRCPQCGLWETRSASESEARGRVIRRTTRFR